MQKTLKMHIYLCGFLTTWYFIYALVLFPDLQALLVHKKSLKYIKILYAFVPSKENVFYIIFDCFIILKKL